MRFLFNLFENYWLPVSYENYNDISYGKPGEPSHHILHINVLTGKSKRSWFWSSGYITNSDFQQMRTLAARRILRNKGLRFLDSSTINDLKSVAETKIL